LSEAGWAHVTLECGDQRVEMTASYLHDSLRDLAGGARALATGATDVRIVFMDEPGEHELILRRRTDGNVDLEVFWYDDWKSWGVGGINGKPKLSGTTSVAHVRGQVLSELRRLLEENGEAGYLKRWIQHPFPTAEMSALEEAG
jgi:hypothetical protein